MIKKLLLIFAVLLLFAVPALADGIYQPVATGTVTQANMRISAAAGVSFVDFTAADVLTGKLGYLLKVRDSAGRAIQGYIKAAGTSETTTDELITGWTNSSGAPFETLTVNANGHDIDAAINSTASGTASAATQAGLSLFKGVFNVTLTTGTDLRFATGNTASAFSPSYFVSLSAGANTKYLTL